MKDRVKTKVIGVPNEHKKLWKPSTFQQTVSYFTKLHHCAWGTRYWNELAIFAQGSSLQYVFDMKWNVYAEIMPVSGHLSIKIRHHAKKFTLLLCMWLRYKILKWIGCFFTRLKSMIPIWYEKKSICWNLMPVSGHL